MWWSLCRQQGTRALAPARLPCGACIRPTRNCEACEAPLRLCPAFPSALDFVCRLSLPVVLASWLAERPDAPPQAVRASTSDN
jgi:hypothetical protein